MFSINNFMIIIWTIIIILLFYVLAFRIEWRKVMDLVLAPLVRSIPPYITPNHVSLAAFFVMLLAAFFIYLAKFDHFFFLWATLLVLLYSLLDSLDGILARTRGQTSKSGVFLDQTLGQVNELALLFALLMGGYVRAELVVITMVWGVFYSFISTQSQVLIGSRLPETDRPRWIVLLILFGLIFFLLKFFGLEYFTIYGREIRSLDAIFVIVPIYYTAITLYRTGYLWRKIREIEQKEGNA